MPWNCWRIIMTWCRSLSPISPPESRRHHTRGALKWGASRTQTFFMTSPDNRPGKRWLNSGKFNGSLKESPIIPYLTFNFQYWRGPRGRRVAKVPSTNKIISRNKKIGRGSEELTARDPGRASAPVNNQGDVAESAPGVPGQGDCGPDCQNLLHELGHPQEAARCPGGQVIDIWGYCRFVIIIFGVMTIHGHDRCHLSPGLLNLSTVVNPLPDVRTHYCCWPGQATFRPSCGQ